MKKIGSVALTECHHHSAEMTSGGVSWFHVGHFPHKYKDSFLVLTIYIPVLYNMLHGKCRV